MNRRLIVSGILWMGAGIIFLSPVNADNSAATAAETHDARILARLDAIENKEDLILRRLEEMSQELDVIKVRASLKS